MRRRSVSLASRFSDLIREWRTVRKWSATPLRIRQRERWSSKPHRVNLGHTPRNTYLPSSDQTTVGLSFVLVHIFSDILMFPLCVIPISQACKSLPFSPATTSQLPVGANQTPRVSLPILSERHMAEHVLTENSQSFCMTGANPIFCSLLG